MESMTKTMNGHSDVILGLVCGSADRWQARAERVVVVGTEPAHCSIAGWRCAVWARSACAPSALRNALEVARMLSEDKRIASVAYPGLADHPDHALARHQFGDRFGSIVTFSLAGGAAAAKAFIVAARRIPFCPSLGELSTTLSHPESTQPSRVESAARAELGITGGTIRLSIGIEFVPGDCRSDQTKV